MTQIYQVFLFFDTYQKNKKELQLLNETKNIIHIPTYP